MFLRKGMSSVLILTMTIQATWRWCYAAAVRRTTGQRPHALLSTMPKCTPWATNTKCRDLKLKAKENFAASLSLTAGDLITATEPPDLSPEDAKKYAMDNDYVMERRNLFAKANFDASVSLTARGFIAAIPMVYNSTPDTDRGFRDLAAALATCHWTTLFTMESFKRALAEDLDLVNDVVRRRNPAARLAWGTPMLLSSQGISSDSKVLEPGVVHENS